MKSHPLLIAAALIILLAGIKAAAALLVPFLLSVFVALIAAVPLSWLIRKGLHRNLASLLSLILVIAVIVTIGTVISKSLGEFNNNELLVHYGERLGLIFSTSLNWFDQRGLAFGREHLEEMFNPSAFFTQIGSLFGTLASALSDGFFILLLAIFLLLEATHIPDKMKLLNLNEGAQALFSKFQTHLNQYLAIKTTMGLATSASVWLMLVVLDIDFPLLWALLAFFLNFIPNIGSLIAAIPPVLLALVDQGWSTAGILLVGYLVINNIYGNVIETRLMGRGLGLSTLVVFLSLIFWGWLLGPIGALLSTPLTMVVKIAIEASGYAGWLAILLSDQKEISSLLSARTNAENLALDEEKLKLEK